MDPKEKRMRDRLAKLEQSLEVAERSAILSVYGELGEVMFVPHQINQAVKAKLIEHLQNEIFNDKIILNKWIKEQSTSGQS